ncbi:hypothetical protein [Streptomyces sp. NPDC001530]|uniref:hypothetical protein n=1 Tax=Streptomyces sp. NPDC001530 TaxID=3364582 RepID=UPI0036BDF381
MLDDVLGILTAGDRGGAEVRVGLRDLVVRLRRGKSQCAVPCFSLYEHDPTAVRSPSGRSSTALLRTVRPAGDVEEVRKHLSRDLA